MNRGSILNSRLVILACLSTLCLISGCASVGVEVWERDILAKPQMQMDSHAIDLSMGDWGSKSHMADLFFDWQIKGGHGVEPHTGWYSQSHPHSSAERYTQICDKNAPEAFGHLRQFELFPKMNALMPLLGYTRDF